MMIDSHFLFIPPSFSLSLFIHPYLSSIAGISASCSKCQCGSLTYSLRDPLFHDVPQDLIIHDMTVNDANPKHASLAGLEQMILRFLKCNDNGSDNSVR
jgi:hypothetical protein